VRAAEVREAYPFLWFFFDWLCWDEFLDSAHCYQYSAIFTTRYRKRTGHGDGCGCRIGCVVLVEAVVRVGICADCGISE
jgi:hypothetical protein